MIGGIRFRQRHGSWRILAVGLVCAAMSAQAQDTGQAQQEPAPYPEFTFKRITVAPSGTGKRISVQIDPDEQARILAVTPKAEPRVAEETVDAGEAPRASGALDWFWQTVSPAVSASRPGRLAEALGALDGAPQGAGAPTPNLQMLRGIVAEHGPQLLVSSVGTQVSPALALAVMAVESAGKVDAVSAAGAQGLMQLMPDTAAAFDVEDSFDPAQNIKGGIAVLNELMQQFERDPILVLAAYNAGPGAVRDHEGVPPFAETRDYVPKVLSAWQVTRLMCQTPPELISDGCVFAPIPSG